MEEKDLVRLLYRFRDSYEKEKAILPYHINLIDELHANENAHTRILLKLLQFNNFGNYPILRSFFDLVEQKMNGNKIGEIKRPQIHFNRENIDGLIEEFGYVVIIENKIHWAVDQDRQIDRYVEIGRRYSLQEDKIFVIYLTGNGDKEVSDHSLDQAKKCLGYIDRQNTGRFVTMNYRMDILPWLEQVVLPGCMLKDEYLISALRQYIDHLKGMFNLRNEEMMMTEKILDEVLSLKESPADKLKQLYDYKECVYQFTNGIEGYYLKMLPLVEEALEKEIYHKFAGQLKGNVTLNPDNICFGCKGIVHDCPQLYFYADILFLTDHLIRWGLVTDTEEEIQKIPEEISEKLKKEFEGYSSLKLGDGYWLCKETSDEEEFWNRIVGNSMIDFLREQYDLIVKKLQKIGLYQENN